MFSHGTRSTFISKEKRDDFPLGRIVNCHHHHATLRKTEYSRAGHLPHPPPRQHPRPPPPRPQSPVRMDLPHDLLHYSDRGRQFRCRVWSDGED